MQIQNNFTKMLLSTAGRFLFGYIVYRCVSYSQMTQAASIDPPLCTPEGIRLFLDQTNRDTEAIQATFDQCKQKFLTENQISPLVKQEVDRWIGTDLGKATPNEIFLAYQLAMISPKPEEVSEQFDRDCDQMFKSFELFRDAVEPLAYYIDNNVDSILVSRDRELVEQDRDLINFVQYTQFCKSITTSAQEAE